MTFILKYLFAFLLLFSSVNVQADDVWVIEVNGGIGPATSDYLTRDRASPQRASQAHHIKNEHAWRTRLFVA